MIFSSKIRLTVPRISIPEKNIAVYNNLLCQINLFGVKKKTLIDG